MSPYITRVIPIFHEPPASDAPAAARQCSAEDAEDADDDFVVDTLDGMRRALGPPGVGDTRTLATIWRDDRGLMPQADLVVDTFGGEMFASASRALRVPVFDILAERPAVVVAAEAHAAADRLLDGIGDATFVGLHLVKHGLGALKRAEPRLTYILRRLLHVRHVVVLNMFTSSYDYAHWPEPQRTWKRQHTIEEAQFLTALCGMSDRVLPCIDLPLPTIAALLTRCNYFIGLDNGIKHLAWALGVPLTYFLASDKPATPRVLRWMPDVHRMLLGDCPAEMLELHIAEAITAASEASRHGS